MQNYYVYLHKRKDNDQIFYVGKGKSRRAFVKKGRNSRWNRIVNKYGYYVEILFDNLTEEEALICEIDVIKELRYFCFDLCNMTDGGEGSSGRKLSDKHRRILSEVNKSRVRTKEEIEKSAISRRGLKKSKEQVEKMIKTRTGMKLSEEQLAIRRIKMAKVDMSKDRNIYMFLSSDFEHFYACTRKQLALCTGIPSSKFRPMFGKTPQRKVQGWYKLSVVEVLILNSILKEYTNDPSD